MYVQTYRHKTHKYIIHAHVYVYTTSVKKSTQNANNRQLLPDTLNTSCIQAADNLLAQTARASSSTMMDSRLSPVKGRI